MKTLSPSGNAQPGGVPPESSVLELFYRSLDQMDTVDCVTARPGASKVLHGKSKGSRVMFPNPAGTM